MNLGAEYLGLAVVAFSVVLFCVSGEGCWRFETKRFFDFANPIYLLILLTSLLGMGVGSFALIWVFKKANKDEG